ncbi:polysaccharide deacetylase family protein [Sulfurospirillum sp. 1612]|uniref:polysaccharide deacetylase family protein n=1 Tax=Sulfurospirillum sp. 1612 TaxID=3094835 RepID=UPI002F93633A
MHLQINKIFFLSLLSAITLWADAHIFVYHRFGDGRHPSTDTTKSELIREFEYFKNNNYKVVPLETLVTALKQKKNIPDNWVVLTIDDNFKSFYENGLEIFKKYHYPFSLFVYVKATEKRYPDYLTWDQLNEIKKYGSLEFHSYAHGHLTLMSQQEIEADFKKGMQLFEKHLHLKPKYFSYPYGEFTPRVRDIVKSFGFQAIINQNIGAVGKNSNVFDLDRSALVGKTNLSYLLGLRTLNATWIEPKILPKDKVLKIIKVKTNSTASKGSIYISKYGWENVTIKNGLFDVQVDKKLTLERNRVIVKIGNKISTKLLIKDLNGTQ